MKDMEKFEYDLAKWIPFRDRKVCKKVRSIKKEDICKHTNPDFKIKIISDYEFLTKQAFDIFYRIKEASEENRKLILILPQPHDEYKMVASMINRFRVSCKNLYTFNMDEYADQDGKTPPENWHNSFRYAMIQNFYNRVDKDLRPPINHINSPTDKNINDYGKMIEDLGGADVCYGGMGWNGHLAFIEPDFCIEEHNGDVEEWKKIGPRIVDLSSFTILQESLSSEFGSSGDWSFIPPKAATIGPEQIVGAKLRNSWNGFSLGVTGISWARFIVRLALYGPVTTKVPASILQTLQTDLFIKESVAEDIRVED